MLLPCNFQGDVLGCGRDPVRSAPRGRSSNHQPVGETSIDPKPGRPSTIRFTPDSITAIHWPVWRSGNHWAWTAHRCGETRGSAGPPWQCLAGAGMISGWRVAAAGPVAFAGPVVCEGRTASAGPADGRDRAGPCRAGRSRRRGRWPVTCATWTCTSAAVMNRPSQVLSVTRAARRPGYNRRSHPLRDRRSPGSCPLPRNRRDRPTTRRAAVGAIGPARSAAAA